MTIKNGTIRLSTDKAAPSLFPLRDAYEFGIRAAKRVNSEIEGCAQFTGNNAGVLAQAVFYGLHGNHIEIGTLFGASAILAALVKKEFGMCGMIHCLDPLDNRPNIHNDHSVGFVASQKLLGENAKRFGVEDRILITASYSYPWPMKGRYATAYIDGDHWNDMPLRDWESTRECVSHLIVFDDYAYGKPDVIRACIVAAQDINWIPVYIGGTLFILRRRE